MKLFSRPRERCFCAFCRSPRWVYRKRHISLTNVLGASLLATMLSVGIWGQPDPRALMFLCLIAGFSELFIYLRWRVALVCRLCGFDPIVYKSSPERAAQRVREFFHERKEDPTFHLSRSPLLDVQKRLAKRASKQNQAGSASLPVVKP